MRLPLLLVLLLTLIVPLVGVAQSPQPTQAGEDFLSEVEIAASDKTIALRDRFQLFDEAFAALRAQQRDDLPALGNRRDALLYQQDQQALQTLQAFGRLLKEISTVSSGDADRVQLVAWADSQRAEVDPWSSQRLVLLESRIDALIAGLPGQTGADRLSSEALIDSLNDQRMAYVEGMINLVHLRGRLDIPLGDIEDVALTSLRAYASELLGAVQLRAANKRSLLEQRAVTGDSPELAAAIGSQQHAIDRAASTLGRVVDELDKLGVDTTSERRALLKQSGTVSVSLVDGDLIAKVWGDVLAAIKNWLQRHALDTAFNVVLFLGILVLARLIARFARSVVRRMVDGSRQDRISHLMGDVFVSLAGGIVLTLGLLIALSQVGVSVAPMLAGLGVAGFIIGFALQDVLGNFAAGAMILTYRPFDTDDYISVAGVDGTVKKMNLVSTTIATLDNQLLIIPNSKIWGDVIRNYTGQRVRRVDLEFSISYKDSIEHAERVLMDVLANVPMVLPDPAPMVRVHRHNASSIDLIVRPWVKTADYWETYWAMQRGVKLAFDAAGITIPFPQRDVHHFYPEADVQTADKK